MNHEAKKIRIIFATFKNIFIFAKVLNVYKLRVFKSGNPVCATTQKSEDRDGRSKDSLSWFV